jgi:hypothetical protein
MKRLIVFSVLAAGLCLNLFSLEFSLGGGMAIFPYAEGLRLTAPGYQAGQIRNHWVDWGMYAFLDVQYGEIDVGFFKAVSGDYQQYNIGDPFDLKVDYDKIDISYLDLGILLKYPLGMGGKNAFVMTPMLGFNYWINLNASYEYENNTDAAMDRPKSEWDQMWIKAGLGFDKFFGENFFLRVTAKLAFPIITEDWKTRGKNLEEGFGIVIKEFKAAGIGGGGEFTLSFGYKI